MPVALEKREKAHFNAANERRHQKLYLAVYPDISGYLSVFICFFSRRHVKEGCEKVLMRIKYWKPDQA